MIDIKGNGAGGILVYLESKGRVGAAGGRVVNFD